MAEVADSLTTETEVDSQSTEAGSDNAESSAPVAETGGLLTKDAPSPEGSGGPANYSDLALPKDSALSDVDLVGVREFAEEHSLSLDQAKALIERDNELRSTQEAAYEQQWEGVKAQMVEKIKLDPELGGENAGRTQTRINAALVDAPEGLAEWLEESGYVYEPKVARFLEQIGASREEPTETPRGNPVGLNDKKLTPKQEWERDYPSSPYPGS